MRVGFIGLGRMGHGMAERILQAGHDLRVYDQVAEATTRLKESGASVAASLSEVSEDRDVVITMLPTDEALEEVVSGDGGSPEPALQRHHLEARTASGRFSGLQSPES